MSDTTAFRLTDDELDTIGRALRGEHWLWTSREADDPFVGRLEKVMTKLGVDS